MRRTHDLLALSAPRFVGLRSVYSAGRPISSSKNPPAPAGVYTKSTPAVSAPVFFQESGTPRDRKAEVSNPPTVSLSPILKVIPLVSTVMDLDFAKSCRDLLVETTPGIYIR